MENLCGHWTLKLQCSINNMFWQTSPKYRPRILQFCHTKAAIYLQFGGEWWWIILIVTLVCDVEIIVAGIYPYTELLDINFVFLTEFNPDKIE